MWCRNCGEVTPVIRSSGRTNWYECPTCGGQVYETRLDCIVYQLDADDGAWLRVHINALSEKFRLVQKQCQNDSLRLDHYVKVQTEKLKLAQEQCQRLWDIL